MLCAVFRDMDLHSSKIPNEIVLGVLVKTPLRRVSAGCQTLGCLGFPGKIAGRYCQAN
ncbi:hypothetical protein OF001_U160007 [Pseudomonas sp. OF001]|nr:hypothetical protein OF001_U160007 [Pseudomonas sp. OF001]